MGGQEGTMLRELCELQFQNQRKGGGKDFFYNQREGRQEFFVILDIMLLHRLLLKVGQGNFLVPTC